MDEAQIVAEKRATVEEIKPAENYQAISVGEDIKEWRPLYQQFGVEPSPRTDEALKKIWEYAKQISLGKDKDSILFEIIRLNNRLGLPASGSPPWIKILNYINVKKQLSQLDSRLREMENG